MTISSPDGNEHGRPALRRDNELLDFVRTAKDIQRHVGCTMKQAKAHCAHILDVAEPSEDEFNRALRITETRQPVRGRAGRPPQAFPASLDAAVLFLELRRRGLTWRQSEDAVLFMTGVGKSALEKYRARAADIMRGDDAREHVACALAVFLDRVKERQPFLEQPAHRIVGELLQGSRQPPKLN